MSDQQDRHIEATVYLVVAPTRTMGNLLCAIHTKEDKELAEREHVQFGRILHGDLQIIIYSPVQLTMEETEQFNEAAIRGCTGQLGPEYMPRYSEPHEDDDDEY
jgi:hypothetical protein